MPSSMPSSMPPTPQDSAFQYPSPFSRSRFFPSVDNADENGLIGVGGKLTSHWLFDAYTHGIFPWPFNHYSSDKPLLGWFSPDPRCIFDFGQFHVSRRLARTCRSGRFEISFDRNFGGVIRRCALIPGRKNETWITPEMIDAYVRFHRRGYAHSVEAWRNGRLVGGVYGIAIRGFFAAESMFFLERDASKVALVALVEHLRNQGFALLDIQVETEHTARFGAVKISRKEYLNRMEKALQIDACFGDTF